MLLCSALLAGAMCATLPSASACPFCGGASLTMSEQLAAADAAVQVQWVSGKKDEVDEPGHTRYQITRVVKGPETLKRGTQLTLDRYRAGKPGDLFLVFGTQGADLEWGSPLEVSETSFNYFAQAPSTETATSKRLVYFLKFLEYSDPVIANDAFAEFANAAYEDVVLISRDIPREKVRQWIVSPEVPGTRLGFYGMLLGLCGDASDAAILKSRIIEKSEEFRLGIDGMMGGYLLLTGDEGLAVIDEHKLADKSIPASETFAAMQALRFMWSCGQGKIAKERLRQSMRLLLDRPEFADLVIADLTRWKDWNVQEKLMELYGAEAYDVPEIRQAIFRYMLTSANDLPQGDSAKLPPHVTQGRKYVAELRRKDPKTVAEAERRFPRP